MQRRLYRQILTIDPRHADALHLLGVVAYQTGRHVAAVDLMSQAIAIQPHFAAFHSNLGNALSELARFAEAIGSLSNGGSFAAGFAWRLTQNSATVLNRVGWFDKALAAAEIAIRFGGGVPRLISIVASRSPVYTNRTKLSRLTRSR